MKKSFPLTTVFLVASLILSSQGWAQQGLGLSNGKDAAYWKAWHIRNDKDWGKSRLNPNQVRELRLAAGIPDEFPGDPIRLVDASSLPGERILLVTSTEGGRCIKARVFSSKRGQFVEEWSAQELPSGAKFCAPATCRAPRAIVVRSNGKPSGEDRKGDAVAIYTPKKVSDSDEVCDLVLEAEYKVGRRSYELLAEKTLTTRCGPDEVERASDEAIRKMSGPAEVVATVKVRPGFRAPFAIVIQKQMDQLHAYSVLFPKGLLGSKSIWDKNGLTPSQCMSAAESAPVERTELPIDSEALRAIIDRANQLDLTTDQCVRNKRGDCVFFDDGTSFLIQVGDTKPVWLTDFDGFALTSENPAFYQWTKSLLAEVAAVQQNNR
jgi:hypothetical protein